MGVLYGVCVGCGVCMVLYGVCVGCVWGVGLLWGCKPPLTFHPYMALCYGVFRFLWGWRGLQTPPLTLRPYMALCRGVFGRCGAGGLR